MVVIGNLSYATRGVQAARRLPLHTGNTSGKSDMTCRFAPLRGHYLVRTISGVRMLGCANPVPMQAFGGWDDEPAIYATAPVFADRSFSSGVIVRLAGVCFGSGHRAAQWANESLAGHLHRGCHNIHGDDPSGWRKPARRDRAGRNAGSGCERRDARSPALSAAVPAASAGPGTAASEQKLARCPAVSRSVADDQSRIADFYRDKIGGLGPP